jgi:D-alanyl-D-alanine carboxypeptidase (penicillin-binding protein 5/6)
VQPLLKNLTDMDLIVEGTDNDAGQDGTRVGIEAGGKYTIRQLLTYLIIKSGNDAANALARANGGYDKTVAEMNATANALGALDTRAATVSGLDGPGQSTSAYDLALFAKADMATPLFPEIVSSVDVRVPAADGEGYIAANDNQLLAQYPGALGGKTGFTDDAGNTFVGMAAKDGRRLVVTMMNGTQQPRRQWMQAASLLDWGFALPAGTAPVGELVNSLAEATGGTSPTPSVPASASVSGSVAGSVGQSATAQPSGAATTPTAGESPSGIPVAWILTGIGVLVVAAGVVLLIRRRHLNKKAAFAGDAKPKPDPAAPGTAAVDEPAEPGAAEVDQPAKPTGTNEPTEPVVPTGDAAATKTAEPTAEAAALPSGSHTDTPDIPSTSDDGTLPLDSPATLAKTDTSAPPVASDIPTERSKE